MHVVLGEPRNVPLQADALEQLLHAADALPKLRVPVGIILVSTLPFIDIVSAPALPKSTLPVNDAVVPLTPALNVPDVPLIAPAENVPQPSVPFTCVAPVLAFTVNLLAPISKFTFDLTKA